MAEGTGRPARRDYTGLRVARWRDIAGMTQQVLADRVGVSREYISMIESGKRAITKRSLLNNLAAALGVGVTDLTGQPIPPITSEQRVAYIVAPALRRALDDPDESIRPRPIDQLADLTDRAMEARMRGNLAVAGRIMPEALAETRVLAESGDHRAVALHAKACVFSALAARLLGFVDLACRLADRAMVHAKLIDDIEYQGAAAYALSTSTYTGGVPRRSLQVARQAVGIFGDTARTDSALGMSVMVHLAAAQALAALGQPDDAEAHMSEATSRVMHVQTDPWRMEIKRASVDMWRINVALENGNPENAPDLARRVDRTELRSADRLGRLHLDTGRGWFARGDYDRSVQSLLEADRIYPLMLWARPQALEIVGQMARDSRRRGGSSELRTLCTRVGIDPLAPPDMI